MQIRIGYNDGSTVDLEGDYEIHDTYIMCRIPTFRGESYKYFDLVVPMSSIEYFEIHE